MKWDIGEPSFEWNGHAEDCLSVKGSGYWNDDHCDTDKHGYLCQIPRAYSGCLGIGNFVVHSLKFRVRSSDCEMLFLATNDTVECGEGSISTERECDVLNCCWDKNADIQCYKPKVLTQNFRGYIDVGDGWWRRNVLVTTMRCLPS